MRALSKKTNITVFLAGMALTLSLLTLVGGWYWIDHMQTKLYETRQNTKRSEDERTQLAGLEKLSLETKEERARLASYIVANQEGVITFLTELETIAKQRGVIPTTNTIGTQPLSSGKDFEELVVTLGLAGPLVEVKEVIRRFERMPYQIRIENVSLRVGGKEGASATLIVVVTKMKPS